MYSTDDVAEQHRRMIYVNRPFMKRHVYKYMLYEEMMQFQDTFPTMVLCSQIEDIHLTWTKRHTIIIQVYNACIILTARLFEYMGKSAMITYESNHGRFLGVINSPSYGPGSMAVGVTITTNHCDMVKGLQCYLKGKQTPWFWACAPI